MNYKEAIKYVDDNLKREPFFKKVFIYVFVILIMVVIVPHLKRIEEQKTS